MNNYVLDASVILSDPHSIYNFPNGRVILPLTVIDQLNKKKTSQNELGNNAREFFNQYVELRKSEKGNVYDGVELENGSIFKIELNHIHHERISELVGVMDNDKKILSVAINLAYENPNENFYMITNDNGFLARADIIAHRLNVKNLKIELFNRDKIIPKVEMVYSGKGTVYVSEKIMNKLRKDKKVDYEEFINNVYGEKKKFLLNQFLTAINAGNEKDKMYGRVVIENNKKVFRKIIERDPMDTKNIRPKNIEQKMLYDILFDPEIELITVIGPSGTGKTLLALAAGMAQIEKYNLYRRLLVTRTMVSVDKDPGAFPGDPKEKADAWVRPIYDNLEFIYNQGNKNINEWKDHKQILNELDYLEAELFSLTRGRTMPYQFIIVDEAQNLTIHQARTIVTRPGIGAKIILVGDPYQVDHPYLDSVNNGLIFITERMKDAKLFATITLTDVERSELTRLANERLWGNEHEIIKRKAV